jgi:hypothetical protein
MLFLEFTCEYHTPGHTHLGYIPMTMWVYTHTPDPPWGYGYEAGVQKSRPLPIPHDTHIHDPPWECDTHAFAYAQLA